MPSVHRVPSFVLLSSLLLAALASCSDSAAPDDLGPGDQGEVADGASDVGDARDPVDDAPDEDPADVLADPDLVVDLDDAADVVDASDPPVTDAALDLDLRDGDDVSSDPDAGEVADADADADAGDVGPELPGQLIPDPPVFDTFRHNHTATLLLDGRVLIAGGTRVGVGQPQVETGEIYDPVTHSLLEPIAMAQSRSGHTATRLTDGRVLLVGGVAEALMPATTTAEVFTPGDDAFAMVDGTAEVVRSGGAAWLVASGDEAGKVMLAGGLTTGEGFPYVTSVELYDPVEDAFTLYAESLPSTIASAAVAELPDGRVIMLGGFTGPSSEDRVVRGSGIVFDPATGLFSETSSMPEGRQAHTISPLPDGRVLIVGGLTDLFSGALATTLLYDPELDEFSEGPTLGDVRYSHSAVNVTSNWVLIIGGTNGTRINDFTGHRFEDGYVYDIALDELIETPAGVPRANMRGVPVLDDRALLAGGQIGFQSVFSDELDVWAP